MANDLGLDETIEIIKGEFGLDSEEGGFLIDQLFWGWTEKNEDFVKILEKSALENARLRFAKAVFGNGGLFHDLEMKAASFAGITELSGASQTIYGYLLAKEMDLVEASENGMDGTLEILGDPGYGQNLVDGFFRQLARRDPTLAWEQAVEWKRGGKELSEGTLNKLATSLFDEGFEEAVGKISAAVDVIGLEPMGVVFERWVDLEVDQATGWFEENKASFEQTELDTFSVAFAKSVQVRDEYDAAWEWIEQVSDPELRKEISGKVWTHEREIILDEAQIDPAGTLGDLVTEGSVHPEFWIKEAFAQWNRSDSEKAATWYAENRESLTPDQNQHVARAYAEEAVASGNLDSAREWAEQVVDPGFLERLNQQITEAEQK